MKLYTNYVYTNWKQQMLSEVDYEDYISFNIKPEDIEIFMSILIPSTMIYKNCVLIAVDADYNQKIMDNFDNWLNHTKDKTLAQRAINVEYMSSIFLHTRSNITERKTLMNVANLIKNNWEHTLKGRYPDRDFEVLIFEEDRDFGITFYEK